MNLGQLRTKIIRDAMDQYSRAGGDLSPLQVADAGRTVLDVVFKELQFALQPTFTHCEDLHEVYFCPVCGNRIASTEERVYTSDKRFTHTDCVPTVYRAN